MRPTWSSRSSWTVDTTERLAGRSRRRLRGACVAFAGLPPLRTTVARCRRRCRCRCRAQCKVDEYFNFPMVVAARSRACEQINRSAVRTAGDWVSPAAIGAVRSGKGSAKFVSWKWRAFETCGGCPLRLLRNGTVVPGATAEYNEVIAQLQIIPASFKTRA